MANGVFDWEIPLIELEKRIAELRRFTDEEGIDFTEEIETPGAQGRKAAPGDLRLDDPVAEGADGASFTTAYHPRLIELIFDDFVELHGDRTFRV